MKCKTCGSPMKLASSSRGYQTYCCVKGCNNSYQFTYDDNKPEVKHDTKRPAENLSAMQTTLAV